MEKQYEEEDFLALSGIQHFAYCERQWGIIHIENQWVENVRTVEGKILHERVDDPYFSETRNNVKIVRSVPIKSHTLGLYGVADVVELHLNSAAVAELAEEESLIRYSIVEYKRGKPKSDDRDEVQLCAQAICLEEMLSINIDFGYLYYGQTKHRHRVEFDNCLRKRVRELTEKMHSLYLKGETPQAKYSKQCKNCSLINVCVPEVAKYNKRTNKYLKGLIDDIKNDWSGEPL
ncbi:CRISPR-associated protein Cas4 [Desulforamulus aquiferis]|uniref:CRISPR-associated exonuclease Cas4 n=1 Tax=Desulforamulus aquiferis TaxID=1397668 RepID=A0AAW7ZHB7_9FIRM|nr:CRISPR-associated protein Cas4 [Desulforamulus aquiferis]MDO7788726.1 CRISPR-associated protein Cas4 [Desulforamulus aquiferis]